MFCHSTTELRNMIEEAVFFLPLHRQTWQSGQVPQPLPGHG